MSSSLLTIDGAVPLPEFLKNKHSGLLECHKIVPRRWTSGQLCRYLYHSPRREGPRIVSYDVYVEPDQTVFQGCGTPPKFLIFDSKDVKPASRLLAFLHAGIEDLRSQRANKDEEIKDLRSQLEKVSCANRLKNRRR